MEWSNQQQVALDTVSRWLDSTGRQQTFRLFGFAGTGKTTLATHLALGAGNVLFAAYTGKAASVLRAKGCEGAMTIHKLIYMPADRSKRKLHELQKLYEKTFEGLAEEDRETNDSLIRLKKAIGKEEEKLRTPFFQLNHDSVIEYADLVIIDECSMVDERMGRDLESFGVPILVLGDPAQLPPVGGGGYFTNQKPDILLTEIHRQARGNPIIELATAVRTGERIYPGQYGESTIVDGKPEVDVVMNADQILVGTNKSRRQCNAKMRKLLGHGENPCPVPGDKLVCLRNDHEMNLLNGTLWEVLHAEDLNCGQYLLRITNPDCGSLEIFAHEHYFKGTEKQLPYWEITSAQCFDFGYALTTHKAQGSQWDNVLVFDESCVFNGTARQWLYTAITRAAKKITICQNFR
ncbi:MAG: AAA family ATPase [Candidatus Sabulitectum sp.]|nr:AAA family ATPase [Candidatus Sabulitectum sp.]